MDNKLSNGAQYWISYDGNYTNTSNSGFDNSFSSLTVEKNEIPNNTLKTYDFSFNTIKDCDQLEVYFFNNKCYPSKYFNNSLATSSLDGIFETLNISFSMSAKKYGF